MNRLAVMRPKRGEPNSPGFRVDENRRVADALFRRIGSVVIHRDLHRLPSFAAVETSRTRDVDVRRQVPRVVPTSVVNRDQRSVSLDGMATEQGYYALAAYFRMLDGKTGLYNMTDVIDMGGDMVAEEPVETEPVETTPAVTEPVEVDDEGHNFPWWLVIVIVVLAGSLVVLVIISKPKKGRHMK